MKNKIMIAVVFALFFCLFSSEARANGNIYADGPPPPPEGGSVRRAPIRRPPQRQPERARTDYATVKPAPQLPSSLEMGIVMLEHGRYQQARLLLQKAVREERGNPHAWYWCGVAHEKTGYFEQARAFYTRAFDLDPGFSQFLRLVNYPDDGYRNPLWDPLRPARIYQVKLETGGVAIVPPDAPEATIRPVAPQVEPIFVPSFATYTPPVYMPPSPEQTQQAQQSTQNTPVYIPPPPPMQ